VESIGSSKSTVGRRTVRRCVCAVLVTLMSVACMVVFGGCSDALGDALKMERQGDLEGALAIYGEMLKSDPDDAQALSGQAVCLMLLKRYDEALTVQERLTQVDPTDVQIRVELGFNYLNHQSRPKDAVRVLREAVKLQPSAKNLCFLAQALEAADDTRGAEETLRQAVASEPGYAYSYQLLSALLQKLGRAEEADQVIQQAVSLGIDVTETP
jgi:tetratricopeptide (TPR) repeat protein